MRELNNGQEEDEKEKKRKWLQRQRMLQDELVKLKFEMIEEGKKRDDIPVRSPYLESVSGRVSPPKEEINELQIGLKKVGRGGEEVPKIPKPPDLAEHIAKILEHENKIKRKRYQMKREGEKVKREAAREGRRGEEAAGREEKALENVSKVGVGDPTKAKMVGKQPTHEPGHGEVKGVGGAGGTIAVEKSVGGQKNGKAPTAPRPEGGARNVSTGENKKTSGSATSAAAEMRDTKKVPPPGEGGVQPPKPPAPLKLSLLIKKKVKKRKVNP